MIPSYILWSVLAMVSYSFVFLFGKLAMQEGTLTPYTVMTVASAVVIVGVVAATAVTGGWTLQSYTGESALYAYAAGIALTLAVVGYFTALSTGPASVVVPIYGMFIVGGSVLGILILNEPVTAQKLAGIALAVTGVVLIAR
jgi:transporter family protein